MPERTSPEEENNLVIGMVEGKKKIAKRGREELAG